MLPSTNVRALTTPAFEPNQFVATKWSTAEDKAKFANARMKFIAHEFPRQSFSKALYQRLSNTFGHIANYNIDGYYSVFFERDADKVVFLDQTLRWPCYGDPTYTFCDVERAVQRRLRAANVIDVFRMREADATRKRELDARSPASEIRREPRASLALTPNGAAAGRPVRGMTRRTGREKKMTEKARDARPPQRAGSSRR